MLGGCLIGSLLFFLWFESCKSKRLKKEAKEHLKKELVKENEDIKVESKRKVELNKQYIENLRESNIKHKEENHAGKTQKKEIQKQIDKHFEQLDNLLK